MRNFGSIPSEYLWFFFRYSLFCVLIEDNVSSVLTKFLSPQIFVYSFVMYRISKTTGPIATAFLQSYFMCGYITNSY